MDCLRTERAWFQRFAKSPAVVRFVLHLSFVHFCMHVVAFGGRISDRAAPSFWSQLACFRCGLWRSRLATRIFIVASTDSQRAQVLLFNALMLHAGALAPRWHFISLG